MQRIANLIATKLSNYADFASCAYNVPYNHMWTEKRYNDWDKNELQQHPFKNLKRQYGHLPLTRQTIINLFYSGNYYEGFLCAMVWGGVGHNIIGKSIFKYIFDVKNRIHINNCINDVIQLLQANDMKNAYLSLKRGTCKISGINESFYTKLLYFAGSSLDFPITKPLILDSNMRDVYKLILNRINVVPKTQNGYKYYWDYCTKMEELRELLFLPTAGHVEALLFCPGIRDYIFH